MNADQTETLQQAVRRALDARTPLAIAGGLSKTFYGRTITGEPLSTAGHYGIINYQPSELVLTARSGTRLIDIERTLAEQGQMLAFEPPQFADSDTLGGVIACGLSGSRRPYTGSARDFVLGCRIINGNAEVLSFGGEVIKNVAGYDVSRLMAGAQGTLGVLLDISLKVLPLPAAEASVCFELDTRAALDKMTSLAAQCLPLSGLAYDGRVLRVRLSGYEPAVAATARKLGGEIESGNRFWQSLNRHEHRFFAGATPLWRISVPPATPVLAISGDWLYDWGGGLRWLRTDAPAATVFELAAQAHGHATLFRYGDRNGERFQPLADKLRQLNHAVKQALDPAGLFNRQRMYRDW